MEIPNLKDVKWVTLGEVPDYLTRTMGITRSRQTVYNWAKDGVIKGIGRRVKLRTVVRANKVYTTRKWVRDFIDATSRS